MARDLDAIEEKGPEFPVGRHVSVVVVWDWMLSDGEARLITANPDARREHEEMVLQIYLDGKRVDNNG